jgi:hypothetical protein
MIRPFGGLLFVAWPLLPFTTAFVREDGLVRVGLKRGTMPWIQRKEQSHYD